MTTSPFRVSVVTLATLALVLALGGSVGCSRDLEVGVVLPLSGDDALYGRSVKLGLELALAELESAGAQPVSFRVVDSRSDANRAAVLTRQLCEGARAIVGGVTAAESAAMLPEVAECDVLMLSVGAGNETMNELAGDALFYRLVPDAEVEAVSIARFVDESLELETLAVVAEGSAYGEGLAAALVEAFPGTVTVLRFSREDRDLSDIVTELQRISPPAVFVAAEGYGLVRAVHAVRAAGFGGWQRPILSGSALASATLLAEMGEASNGIVFAQGRFDPGAVDGVNEPLRSFVESYRARYGELPDHYAARGYDAVRVLAEAVESGGGASPMELERGLRGLSDFDGVTGPIQFREGGGVQRFTRVYAIREGSPVDYREHLEARKERLRERLRRLRAEAAQEQT